MTKEQSLKFEKIIINSGCTQQVAKIPFKNLIGSYSIDSIPPVKDVKSTIEKALEYPIGIDSIKEIAISKKQVVILCDDNTRSTPAHLIMPILLRKLNEAGIYDDQIEIIFATGSHRFMTEDEVNNKIGEEIALRIKYSCHDYKADDLVYVGETRLNTPIWVNPKVAKSDFVIGIGNIIPHRYCGWAGGGKIVQPGVCGYETLVNTHLLVTRDSNISLGSTKNVALKEIREVAIKCGLKFIINTILDCSDNILYVVAGDVIKSHEVGIKKAQEVLGLYIPKADVVIVSAYPEYTNLWQSLKSLYSAEFVVKDDGWIILVTDLPEGVGEHRELVNLLKYTSYNILEKIESFGVKDRLGAAAAYASKKAMERSKNIIVTKGISTDTANAMGFIRFENLQDSISFVISKNPKSKIVVLKEGPNVLPLVTKL